MNQRPHMRIGNKPPKVEWRTIAITDADPGAFAASLQSALQDLSDGGYSILMQLSRGPAHIILANRAVTESSAPTLPPPPRRTRHPSTGRIEEQFDYHWMLGKEHYHKSFTSMAEALRLLKQHVNEDDGILPAYLISMTTTTFEATSFSMLLQAYADEIDEPKQVD